MKSHPNTEMEKTVLVISDLHLGAGPFIGGRKNFLEDFPFDEQLSEFLNYYSSGDYADREVELIINGDLFDLLAVPFVRYFDDEFWSEKAALEKLKMVIKAHPEVIVAFNKFLSIKWKKIVYIIGNHDAEMLFKGLQKYLIHQLPEYCRENFIIRTDNRIAYTPIEGVAVMHGHEYEFANVFDTDESVIQDNQGHEYFVPPWGSYYVTRVINKFKGERRYVNAVKPVRYFIIHGFIYEPLFTLRFLFASFFYFFMVRFLHLWRQTQNKKSIINYLKQELAVFRDYEEVTQDYFLDHPNIKVLIVGHSHMPCFTEYADGPVFINTGTWTRTHRLGFSERSDGVMLTFAQIDLPKGPRQKSFDYALNIWKGRSTLPFIEY